MASSHVDALDSLVKEGGAPELKPVLNRLSVEIKDRLSKGSSSSFQFFASALESLGRIRGLANAELRLACAYDCGTYFFTSGHVGAASAAAAQVNALANRTNSKPWMRKGQAFAGMIHADSGNVADALIHYGLALNLARELQDFDGEVTVLVNLAVALNYGGLYEEAIPYLKQAEGMAASRSHLGSFRGAALTNLAQSYLYLDEFEKGFAAISLALDLSDEPHDYASAFSRTTREFTFVQLALELGKLALARQHSAHCSRIGLWGGGARLRAMAEIARSLCEIHGGDVESGITALESTLSICEDIGSARTDALIALVKAYDEIGRPELALQHLTTLLSHMRSRREKGLLSLLSTPELTPPLATGSGDLQPLEFREAKLRTQVAERELGNSRIEMLERLAVAADLKEDSSGEHGYRVGRLAAHLAEDLGWTKESIVGLEMASRLHDMGKIGLPDRILLSSNELKDAERHFVSAHTVIGAELLARSNIPQLRMAEEIARHHHEWWDGTGYPTKLSGKRIPIHARIVALADVFDALTHGRPFAAPWSMDRALEEIRSRKGTQFDPDLTDRFIELITRLRAEHQNLDEYLGQAGRNSPFLQARNKIRLMLALEHENERKATVAGTETRH
jgi:putative two-component system response regulator